MPEIETRRWTREEFYRMADKGLFKPDERVELIDGEILTMTPQGSPHATAIHLALKALSFAFGPEFYVRIQGPLALDELSEPEPDVAVVQGSIRDYSGAHPTTALLVVEVSSDTIAKDRKRKGSLYARAGISDYWIINLIDRQIEIYRNPAASVSARYQWEYKSVSCYSAGQTLSPLHASQAVILVDDLLP